MMCNTRSYSTREYHQTAVSLGVDRPYIRSELSVGMYVKAIARLRLLETYDTGNYFVRYDNTVARGPIDILYSYM